MPINLRYGQKAVELGFLTQQRLQMVLNKQRQLAEQGKKVSVRMILEKANLLDAEQISQVDAALNIKVVKKKTTRIPAKPAPAPAPAAEFKGDEQIPDYGAQNATEYSPPVMTPAQDLAAEPGLDPEPFDDGPGLEPEPMDAGPGFEPEPMDAGAGLEPEPMGAEADFAPEPMEDVGFTPAPIDAGPGFMPEPMDAGSGFEPEPFDAGPGLEPEPMEAQPFGEPMGFDDDQGFAPEPMGLDAEPVGFGAADEVPSLDAGPEMAEPSLDAGDEMGFGDVPSIDEPESLDTAPEPEPEVASVQDAWGEDSAPVDDWGAEAPDTMPQAGAMGGEEFATVFSPPPPGMGHDTAPEPEVDSWGEDEPAAAGFDDYEEAPPPGIQLPSPEDFAAPSAFAPPGASRPEPAFDAQPFDEPEPFEEPEPEPYEEPEPVPYEEPVHEPVGASFDSDDDGYADNFVDVDVPMGRSEDDVPTLPSEEDDVHPLRRPGTGLTEQMEEEEAYEESLPAEEPAYAEQEPYEEYADDDEEEEEEEDDTYTAVAGKKKRSKVTVLLTVVLVLIVVVAVTPLIPKNSLPSAIQPLTEDLRSNEYSKPVYDYVQASYNSIYDNRTRYWHDIVQYYRQVAAAAHGRKVTPVPFPTEPSPHASKPDRPVEPEENPENAEDKTRPENNGDSGNPADNGEPPAGDGDDPAGEPEDPAGGSEEPAGGEPGE